LYMQQVVARRDDMPAPIAADLRPCADRSAVRTALMAWPRRAYAKWERQTDRRRDVRIAASFNPPPYGGDIIIVDAVHIVCGTGSL